MLAPPSHISTTKINSVALKGQLTRGSTALQMLCRNSEQAKVALLIFTLAVPHTSKGRSLIKALGQRRAQGEWLTGGDEGQILQAQRNVPSSPGLYLLHQVFPFLENGNLNTALCIPLAPITTLPHACGSSKTLQKLRPKRPQKGLRLKPQKGCFLKVFLREETKQMLFFSFQCETFFLAF